MLELYYYENSICAERALLALAEKQIRDWVPHHIDLFKREQFTPAYLKLNPRAQVPTLVHDGQVIRESSVIADYIDDLKSEENHGNVLTHEAIAEANPDWLFVIDRGAAVGDSGASAQATLDTPLVAGTRAWTSGQVVYLDPTPLYIAGGGYTAMTRAIDQLTEALSR